MLNVANTTPAQVRFVWPAVVQLLKQSSPSHPLLAGLQRESPRAGDNARIPAEVQAFIKPTYDIVTKSILLQELADNPQAPRFRCRMWNMQFSMDGNTFSGA
jgi:hypothetical protein